MKTVAFISGKGGTGKTSLVASFAHLAAPVIVADCDVDAANAALLMPGRTLASERFVSGQRAIIDAELCTGCGLCEEGCRFGALSEDDQVFAVTAMACEGCGVCQLICPERAITMAPNEAGAIKLLQTDSGLLVQGELHPGQGNSGKLVARVREIAKESATEEGIELVLLDGPPGVGCAVHATLAHVDLAVLITEPTPSGELDLDRALELTQRFNLRGVTIINKADLSEELSKRLERRSTSRGAPIIGRLPFTQEAPSALAQRRSLLEIEGLRDRVEAIWLELRAILSEDRPRSELESADLGR